MKDRERRKDAQGAGAAAKELVRDIKNECSRVVEGYRSAGKKLNRERLDLYRGRLDALCMGTEDFKGILEEDQDDLLREYRNRMSRDKKSYLFIAERIDEDRRKEAESGRKSLEEERACLLARISRIQEEADAYEKAEAEKTAAKIQRQADRRAQKAVRRENRARAQRALTEIRAIRAESRRDMIRDRLESAAQARKKNQELFLRKLETRLTEARLELLKARTKLEEFSRRERRNENEKDHRKAV